MRLVSISQKQAAEDSYKAEDELRKQSERKLGKREIKYRKE